MTRLYTVKDATTLSQVAARVYGDPTRWPEIWRANQSRLKSGDPDTVFQGEQLVIPSVDAPAVLSGVQPEDLTIMIAGQRVPVLDARIVRTMDTGADGWTARIHWTPGADPDVDKSTRPYSYAKAAAYIGDQILVNGLLYSVETEYLIEGRAKTLRGYSFTADAIDSTIKPPYERNNITLEQLAADLVAPTGIKAVFETDTGGPFDRVTAQETDTIFSHLAKLAAQRGVLVSSTVNGDMVFLRAAVDSPIVGTIAEGQPIGIGYRAVYDGRKRFNAYKCIAADAGASLLWTDSPSASPKTQTAVDNIVPRSRFRTFQTDDTMPGNIKNAAEWRRSRQLIEALTMEFPVFGWYAPDGNLWRENTRVTVVSETLGVPDGYTFIIRAVEYALSGDGRVATLSLIPPQAYTGEPLEDIWT